MIKARIKKIIFKLSKKKNHHYRKQRFSFVSDIRLTINHDAYIRNRETI